MAATAEPTRGGKRRLDANINLVPYVDMLMTIMAFLVMTAAWTKLSVIEAQAQTSSSSSTSAIDEHPQKAVKLSVHKGGAVVVVADASSNTVSSSSGRPDARALASTVTQMAGSKDLVVDVSVDDGVAVDDVASVLDAMTPFGVIRFAG